MIRSRICLIAGSIAVLTVACSSMEDPAAERRRAAAEQDASSDPTEVSAPIEGVVRGAPFRCDRATIKDGILTLRQGEDFFADLAVNLFLFIEPGEVPEHRRFQRRPGEPSETQVHLHASRIVEERGIPDVRMAMDGFELMLEFGEVRDKKLPGTIRLVATGDVDTRLEGRFVADVEGFILVHGRPDRTSDSLELLRWLAREHVERTYGLTEVRKVDFADFRYQHPSERKTTQIGSGDVHVELASGETATTRLRFLKGAEGWAVAEEFDTATLLEAHPPEQPSPDDPYAFFIYRVAQFVEDELQTADASAHGVEYDTRWNRRTGQGEGQIRYAPGPDANPIERRFLFRLDGETWELDRELKPGEEL